VNLRSHSIVISAPQELCFELVAAAGRLLEKRSESEWVVEFATQSGNREIRTVELLVLDRPQGIRYRLLEGHIPDVREAITFTDLEDGTTRLDYRAASASARGPIGRFLGGLRIKPVFDQLVAEHLLQAKEIDEARARRTRVHPRNGRRSSK
jgi:hypothetical protein